MSPDNSESAYINTLKSKFKSLIHISWIEIYEYLSSYKANNPILKSLIDDCTDLIKRDILDRDFVAAFIKFTPGPLEYYDNPEDFFNELFDGKISTFHIPQKTRIFLTPGRKIIFGYKSNFVGEVEVEKVITSGRKGYYKYRVYLLKKKRIRFSRNNNYEKVTKKIKSLKNILGRPNYCKLTRTDYDLFSKNIK